MGPAVDTQSKSFFGWPLTDTYFVDGTGLNKTYDVAAPIKSLRTANVYVSNYFETADHAGAPVAGTPAGMDTGVYTTQGYYQWVCVDRANEIKARIRLQVREWNTAAAFDDRVNTPTGHSTTGNETSPVSGVPINDFEDWKDLGASYPGFLR
jgi:hypothetical protein